MKEICNTVDYSSIKRYYSENPYRGFGVKYVVSGTELYTANGNRFFVKNNEYLLTNEYCEGSIEIDSKEFVKGICIDLSPSLISEVITAEYYNNEHIDSSELVTYFKSVNFLENKYHATQSSLGRLLLNLEHNIKTQSIDLSQLNNEFYFTVAEKIIQDNRTILNQLKKLRTAKANTKKDLLRKLLDGKRYLEQHYHLNIKIEEVAKQAAISEYHFYRLFKNVFGVSPYQFLVQLRLENARNLIIHEQEHISSIALKMGFADVQSFSKAFKKHFGFPPSALPKI